MGKNFLLILIVFLRAVVSCTETTFDVELHKKEKEMELVYSTNLLDTSSIVRNHCITDDGQLQEDYSYSYTDFIPVETGDSLVIGNGIHYKRYFRFVTAYNKNKKIIKDAGESQVMEYVVPSNVSYVRFSIYNSDLNSTTRINKGGKLLRYEPYYAVYIPKGTRTNRKSQYTINNMPLTAYGQIEDHSYKPLGKLKRGYFCLMSDDGYEGVATYSIPMAIEKDVPMTFAVMKGSPVLEPPYLDILKDAVENHGCRLAYHGFTRYTEFNEDQLNYFFDLEKEYFDSLGLDVWGAVCPAHNINDTVAAVAGKRFGVVRSGYSAGGDKLMPTYGWYMNGEESNKYALNSINISTEPLGDHYAHIDYCRDNHLLLIGFYHEWELNDEKKAKIESIIDYAKEQGLVFITLDNIDALR